MGTEMKNQNDCYLGARYTDHMTRWEFGKQVCRIVCVWWGWGKIDDDHNCLKEVLGPGWKHSSQRFAQFPRGLAGGREGGQVNSVQVTWEETRGDTNANPGNRY